MLKIENLDLKNKRKCNITFIIGNGFDIGLGMKTKYENMYDDYINSQSKSTVIENFKKALSKRKPYDKWSDFEMGMAQYASKFTNENELIECIRDFKMHLLEHLRDEYKKIADQLMVVYYRQYLIQELDRSLYKFHKGLIPNDIRTVERIINNLDIDHNFITFNYTNTLETLLLIKRLYTKVSHNAPIHIHGSLDQDIVLGIDNICQISHAAYTLTNKGERAFVKPSFNNQYDSERVEKAKTIIANSDIICTYGFSFGESDNTWIQNINHWLLEDNNHHLIVYEYDDKNYNRCNSDELMDIEEDKKYVFLNKMSVPINVLLEQIHIPIYYDIFDFKDIINSPKPKATSL